MRKAPRNTEELRERIRAEKERRGQVLVAARAEAATRGKQPFDAQAVDRLRRLRPRRPEPPGQLEYDYYVSQSRLMTLVEFARWLDVITHWSD